MASVYGFQVALPTTDTLARNRIVNKFHMEHITGGLDDGALENMAQDIVALYQSHYANATSEIHCKVYDNDEKPNFPRADVLVNAGVPWTIAQPREITICLSYAGEHRGNKRERGRMYLQPGMSSTTLSTGSLRPSQSVLDWALAWYTASNDSLPDLGGVDWKFGVYSTMDKKFTQTQQAWVNDDWDVMRSRGLRESTRVSAVREG